MDEERILTLHPQGKKGVHILKRQYDVIKNFILEISKNIQSSVSKTYRVWQLRNSAIPLMVKYFGM